MALSKKTRKKAAKGLKELDVVSRLGDTANILAGATIDEVAAGVIAIGESVDKLINEGPFKTEVILKLIHGALPSHPRKSGKILGIRDLEALFEVLINLPEYLLRDEDEDEDEE